MKNPLLFLNPLAGLLLTLASEALSPGDLMFVGFNSQGNDSFSFVTWVELPANETILFMDGRYDGGGDESGEGIDGGYYESARALYWTNENSPLAAGSVVILSNLTTTSSTPSIGTSTGGFALTNQGEQFFIAQGTIEDDNGNDYLDGNLIFGLDYEGSPAGWTNDDKSQLPTAIEGTNGNISFAHADTLEFSSPRNNLPLTDYDSEVANNSNWSLPLGGLSNESFVAGNEPPAGNPDELGEASEGLWFHTKRLNNGLPILDENWMLAPTQGMHPDETDNINGPSCIRLPSWLPAVDRADPTAVYYLYFANHQGKFIRMAWAANIEGPWTGFQLDDSLPIGDRGVLSLGSADTILPGNGIEVKNHIASPQVFVDDVNQRFIMYYHGPTDQDGESRGQSTLVATSSDGLNFNLPSSGGQIGHGTRPVILGESYFRVFEEAGNLYAFSNTGDIWESPDPLNPWTPPAGYDYRDDYWDRGPKPFTDNTAALGWPDLRPRHFAVLRRGDVLYAFLTNKDARPERILAASFDFSELGADYQTWTGDFPHQEILRAEETWEGAQFPELPSDAGAENSGVNQLRDPEVFEDSDGRIYLFYSGQGEDAIGLAQLVVVPQVTGNTEVTTGKDETFTVSTEVDVTNAVRKIEHTTPIAIDLDAEGGTNPLTYAGNGNYSVLQSQTVASGSQSFQLAHFAADDSETLTFPSRYYAQPGATLSFQSRLGASTNGQLAEVQISFDDILWQSIWQRVGGSSETSFSQINLALDGLEGRTFSLRFRYIHQNLRNNSITAGSSAGRGWFLDEIVGEGLESVTNISEVPFTASSFTLDDIASILSPYLSWNEELEDRFLLSVSGLHDGESTGYGKPFVIRVRSSYEDFLATYFSENEQADPLISGLDADPEGDGLTNLMEHAFGTEPDVIDSSVTQFGMTAGGAPAPFLSFNWNPNASVRYYLQMSPDLDDFADISSLESSTEAGDLLNIVLAPGASVPLGDQAFFRLRIEAQ